MMMAMTPSLKVSSRFLPIPMPLLQHCFYVFG